MKTKFLIVLPLTLCSLTAVADFKSFPGSYCVEVGDTTPEIFYDSLARAANDATGANTFICGAMKDLGSLGEINVSVYDANGSDNFSCNGQTRTADGELGAWTPNRSSSGLGSQMLALGSLTNNPTNGYHFVRCTVPGRSSEGASRINSFNINER